MSFGFFGIQFGWGLQMANMSAIYQYLGAREEDIPILWLAAPLTGLVAPGVARGVFGGAPLAISEAGASARLDAPQSATLLDAAAAAARGYESAKAEAARTADAAAAQRGGALDALLAMVGLKPAAPDPAAGIGAARLEPLLASAPGASPASDAERGNPLVRTIAAIVAEHRLAPGAAAPAEAVAAAARGLDERLARARRYQEGVSWAGVCFAMYNLVAFLFAFLLLGLVKRASARAIHIACLTLGGLGLLLVSMAGVGVAWASILAMPYAMLSNALPPLRMGCHMGVFNFFIVLPQILASGRPGLRDVPLARTRRHAGAADAARAEVRDGVTSGGSALSCRAREGGGMTARRAILTLVGLALLAPHPGTAAVQPADKPAVLKVEPPSWWPGHTLDPVRLMLRGHGLTGARVEAAPASGLSVGLVRVNPRGTHLFVDVTIDAQAAPGRRSLDVVTAGGRASFDFELIAPLARAGRFQGFSADDVIYLIMPDRFANGDPANDASPRSPDLLDRNKARHFHGGDLQGVIDRLPYLKDLGATAIWLNPIYDNTDRLNFKEVTNGEPMTGYHGYHAEDFYAVDERFGDLAKLRELVDAAHVQGIKIIQDQVANHTGPYHYWLSDPPTPTWFYGTETRHLSNTWQVWTLADPHASEQAQKATLEGWFIDVLPDLNQDDEETARYIIQNTLWWVGVSGLDGIRQDTLPYVHRRFWREWMAAIKREYPRLRVVGELFDGDPALVSFFQTGAQRFDGIDSGIDALFDFPLFFPLRRAFGQGHELREVARALGRDHLYPDPSRLVTFLGLHDLPRFLHEPGATPDGLKLAFTFLLTTRGIPLVYYGDEIAMRGAGDPDNRRDFPGGFAGDPQNAFLAASRTPEQQDVFAHVQRLARLRAARRALRSGATRNLLVEAQQWAYARAADSETLVVALNNAGSPATIDFDVRELGLAEGAELEDTLGGARYRVVDGRLRVPLDVRGAVVLVPRR